MSSYRYEVTHSTCTRDVDGTPKMIITYHNELRFGTGYVLFCVEDGTAHISKFTPLKGEDSVYRREKGEGGILKTVFGKTESVSTDMEFLLDFLGHAIDHVDGEYDVDVRHSLYPRRKL